MVEMARRLPPGQRLNILTTLGWIVTVTAACLESNDVHYRLETHLVDGYYEAVRDCLPLLAETLLCEQKASDIVGIQ
jgi:hypothetical protein